MSQEHLAELARTLLCIFAVYAALAPIVFGSNSLSAPMSLLVLMVVSGLFGYANRWWEIVPVAAIAALQFVLMAKWSDRQEHESRPDSRMRWWSMYSGGVDVGIVLGLLVRVFV